jgi:hypothetical protein
METKEIIGETHNLLFYYPLDCNELHAQIYNKNIDDVVEETIVHNQFEYEMCEKHFNWLYKNRIKEVSFKK